MWDNMEKSCSKFKSRTEQKDGSYQTKQCNLIQFNLVFPFLHATVIIIIMIISRERNIEKERGREGGREGGLVGSAQ